ncbi:GNAT family N-acetyltransferase [Dokdonia sp.]|uniref:GNAT family N-acetyltransferase n=1 Tax=Dokdonia sp. TaxID=2024995 RepID=UPI003267CEC1
MKLREFKNSDALQLSILLNNKKIWDNLRNRIPYPYALEDAKEFIQFCQSENPQTTFIIEKEGTVVGVIGLIVLTDVYCKSAEIGYWLGEPFWNKGIMTKAIQKIVTYGFDELDLVRIFAGVFENNKSSQKVLEKAGFKFECIFEKAIFKNGQLLNEYRYSKINTNI